MASNKTPSSHSGYFTELTSSAGRQSHFLLPFKIKMTPNTSMRPLSDGKKKSKPMLQPVLIKDLFKSTKKDSTLMSVSTQKKRARPLKSIQPYLNTQSCHKPKKDEDEGSSLFNMNSGGGSKVRRQLYQTYDSPQKLFLESKQNINKIIKPKKLIANKNIDENVTKNIQADSKSRKSLLMPPNTIKNSFLNKSGSNIKTLAKQTVKSSTVNVNKYAQGSSKFIETRKQGNKINRNNTKVDTAGNFNFPSNYSDNNQQSPIMRDNFTMTSPLNDRKMISSKILYDTNNFERPSVIISPSRRKSASKYLNNEDPFCLEIQNLNINKTPCHCVQATEIINANYQNIEFDLKELKMSDYNGLMQIKWFLEKSLENCESQAFQFDQALKACKDQASNLKQAIDSINNVLKREEKESEEITVETAMDTQINKNIEDSEKCNLTCTISISEDNSNISDISRNLNADVDKSFEKLNMSTNASTPDEAKTEDKTSKVKEVLLPSIKILVNDADLNHETKEVTSETLNDGMRLSTIGEVSCEISCEVSDPQKDGIDDTENKENVNDIMNNIARPSITTTPKTPKTPRRRSSTDICNSNGRRRSARLAAKSMSQLVLSDSDKQDSFTLLENELNVVRNPAPPSKSLPASPTKASLTVTPPMIRQWDKRIERPLKEYMALKMNGSFLVTPDVKRFQSFLETTDTPHSRKSLSRKIFMELCDLYAESPEHY